MIVSASVIAGYEMDSEIEGGTRASIEIRLLGTPAVLSGGQPLSSGSRKATALLAYLAMRPDEPASRDHLAGLLWRDSDNEQARANLRQALTQLRRLFRDAGLDAIKTSGDDVMLSSHGLSIDAHQLAGADTLPEGSRLRLDKEFLEGFTIAEPEFEQWLTAQRESLRSRARLIHELCADEAIENRQVDRAIDHLSRALNLDPLQEQIHRRLMELLAA